MGERIRACTVLAGLLVLASTTDAGVAPPRAASLPDPARLAARARDVRVERLTWDEAAARERSEPSVKASPEWLQRLVAAGLGESRRLPDSTCAVACRRCPEQLRVEVHFMVDARSYALRLSLREGFAFLGSSDAAGVWALQDSLGAVLSLIREALPNDALAADWRPPAELPVALDVDAAASRDDDLLLGRFPQAVTRVPPSYPELGREKGATGLVEVEALVAADGTVQRVRVARSVRYLDQAALDAVSQWRFKPVSCAGHPVAVWVTVPVRFSIH